MVNNYNSFMIIVFGSKKIEIENFYFVNVFVIIEVVY